MMRLLLRVAVFLGSAAIGLVVASVLTHGLSIDGIASWVGATVIVWLVRALASVVLGNVVVPAKASV